MEDDVDAGGQLVGILGADGEARLGQLAADGYDLAVEVGVVLPHAIEELRGMTGGDGLASNRLRRPNGDRSRSVALVWFAGLEKLAP